MIVIKLSLFDIINHFIKIIIKLMVGIISLIIAAKMSNWKIYCLFI